jgi:hypothetical protein
MNSDTAYDSILSVGPQFIVNAQGIATLDTELNMAVDLAYTINNAKLFFPPGKNSSGGDFAPADTGLSKDCTITDPCMLITFPNILKD